MIKELTQVVGRFIITLFLYAAATVHTLIFAVPDVSRPGAVAASIAAALLVAMYDIGVFRVNTEDLTIH